MKRAAKIWLIVAAALVLIGGILFVAVMTQQRWNFGAFKTEGFGTETVEIDGAFTDISIHSTIEEIAFAEAEDGKCKVVFYDHPKVEKTAEVRDGTLTVKTAGARPWYKSIFSFSTETPRITVYLSESAYKTLTVRESTGDAVIPNAFAFEVIDVEASTGDIACYASATEHIRIKTTTGDVRVEGINAGALTVTTTTGSVNLASVVCDGEVSVTVSTGKARLKDVTAKTLASEGSTGDLAMENVLIQETVSIRRSTGDVRMTACDASALTIETETGDVIGTLLSAKVFQTKTDTGDVSVPASTSGGACRITTHTGDIRIALP